MNERETLIRRAENACRPCGPCDAGLPMGCNCDPEPRAVIAGLLDLHDDLTTRLAKVETLVGEFEASGDLTADRVDALRRAAAASSHPTGNQP